MILVWILSLVMKKLMSFLIRMTPIVQVTEWDNQIKPIVAPQMMSYKIQSHKAFALQKEDM